MRYRSMLAVTAVTALAAATTVVTATTSSAVDTTSVTANQSSQPAGSFALSGQAAAHYKLPSGMRELHTATFPDGRTQTRYQQVVDGASVFGGQVTVIRSAAGEADDGHRRPLPGPAGQEQGQARPRARPAARSPSEIGTEGTSTTTLRIDPRPAGSSTRCRASEPTQRPVRWVDATTGEIIKSFDARHRGRGHRRQGRHQDDRHHAERRTGDYRAACPATTARRPTTR